MNTRVLGLGLAGIAGVLGSCSSDFEIREADVLSLMGPDSVAAGAPLTLVYAMHSSGGSVFHRWHTANDSTYILTVLEKVRDDGVGPLSPRIETGTESWRGRSALEPWTTPAYIRTKTAILEAPPSRPFVIRATGLVFRVQGGADPTSSGQLTVEVQDGTGAPVSDLPLALHDGPQTVPLDPTDAEGVTKTPSTCSVPGGAFSIESISAEGPYVQALGRWPADCAISARLVTAIR